MYIFVVMALQLASPAPQPAWQTSWDAAFRLAKQQRRMVFVDYVTNACKPCEPIERLSLREEGAVLARLSDFVLLRLDVTRNAVPRAHREYNPPVYVVFDPGERERFRITSKNLGALYPRGFGWWPDPATGVFDRFLTILPKLLDAADLFDAGKDVDANFVVGDAYASIDMTVEARSAYDEARKAAAKRGDDANVQRAVNALAHLPSVR